MMFPALILLTAINPVTVAAEEIDLLRGVTFTKYQGNANVSNISRLTDGNDLTFTSWSYSFSDNSSVRYIFPEAVNISSGKFVAKTGSGTRSASYFIYDSSGKQIANGSAGGKSLSGNISIPALYDVKEVRVSGGVFISSGSGNEYSNVGSIELYEASGNPDSHLFVISGLAANQSDEAAVRLKWDAIKSNYFDHYKVYKDGEFIATTKVTSLLIDELEFGETYEFSVSPVDTMDKEYSSSAVSYTVPIPKPPDKPTGLEAKMSADFTKINVTWDKPTDSNLSGYDLYISEDGGEYAKLNNALLTGRSYTYTNFKIDSLYEFRLIAIDQKGRESEPSVTSIKAASKPLTENEQENTPEYIIVRWQETQGAVGYLIYLNGKQVGSVGPDVREFKITKEMGYKPELIRNVTDVRAKFEDGTIGEGDNTTNPSNPGAGWGFDSKDVWDSALSLFSSLAIFLLLGIVIRLAPRIFQLLRRAVIRLRSGEG